MLCADADRCRAKLEVGCVYEIRCGRERRTLIASMAYSTITP